MKSPDPIAVLQARPTVFSSFAAAAMLAITLVGCANWKDSGSSDLTAAKPATLGATAESRKRVVLEVEFVNVAVNESVAADEDDPIPKNDLWQWVDETAIDAVLRRKLIHNGIRVGIVSNQESFRDHLESRTTQRDVVDTFLAEASIASEVSHGTQRIPMRIGQRKELALRQPFEGSHVALVRLDGETFGRTLSNAQYFFAITTVQANTHNQVHLQIRPEVQYGDTRQKWVSSDSAFRIYSRRETWSIPELELDVIASEGDTLVFAATQPLKGLAKHMLTGNGSDHGQQQVVVLIRVVQVPSTVDLL